MAVGLKIGLEGASVVVTGAFNPAIFSPLWLKDQGLIGDPEIADQKIEIITRDLAVFNAGWLKVQITPEGLQFSTDVPEEFDRLRDAVVGVLRALAHTPIASMGFNRDYHLVVDSMDAWHAIGDALTPKTIWSQAMKIPGMRNLTMWDARPDSYSGHVQVSVEPSLKLPKAVYVGTNDHYELTLVPEGQEPTRDDEKSWDLTREIQVTAEKIPIAIQILTEEWSASLDRAENFAALIGKLAKG